MTLIKKQKIENVRPIELKAGTAVFATVEQGAILTVVGVEDDKVFVEVKGRLACIWTGDVQPAGGPPSCTRLARVLHNNAAEIAGTGMLGSMTAKAQGIGVVVDGEPECDGIVKASVLFSPDGSRVAYVALEG